MKKLLALLFFGLILLAILAADTDSIPTFIRDLYRFPGGDLIGHFTLYGILAFLLAWAYPRRWHIASFTPAVTSLWVFGLALAEELSQLFIPWRTPSLLDLACGTFGIVFADSLALLINRLGAKKKMPQ